jgi:hypothetical protein
MAAAAAQGQGQLMIYIPAGGDGAPRLAYAPGTLQVREQVGEEGWKGVHAAPVL